MGIWELTEKILGSCLLIPPRDVQKKLNKLLFSLAYLILKVFKANFNWNSQKFKSEFRKIEVEYFYPPGRTVKGLNPVTVTVAKALCERLGWSVQSYHAHGCQSVQSYHVSDHQLKGLYTPKEVKKNWQKSYLQLIYILVARNQLNYKLIAYKF